jgi:hypothetical protein
MTLTPAAPHFECLEPDNNALLGACGPLRSGIVYRDYISAASDEYHWFYFDLQVGHAIEAWLTEIPDGCDFDLYLTDGYGELLQDSANGNADDEHILAGPHSAGRYHLVVVSISGWNASSPYALRVSYE